MKKIAFIIVALYLVLSFNLAQAHPGRTDNKGGHICKTKCEEWGLKNGRYHYHQENKSPIVKYAAKKEAKKKARTSK